MRRAQLWLTLPCLLAIAGGCDSLADQAKPDADGSILRKTTQDIGEFDPNKDQAVSDSKVNVTNPVTGPLEAYGPMVEQISKTHVQHALGLYMAEHGRYPKDHDEFMTEIIKKNNIQLPVLPGGKKYEYDVENHKLVVVDGPAKTP